MLHQNRHRISLGLLVAVAALFLGMTPLVAQETSVKIAVVDLDRVVASSQAGQALAAKLKQFQQSVQAEGEGKAAALKELQQRAATGANSLSEEKLAELQKEYEDATIDLRRFRDDKTRQGQKMQDEALQEIEGQLEPVFQQIRDEGGYDLILNYVPGVVVMAGEKVDITALVIERFNASLAAGGQ